MLTIDYRIICRDDEGMPGAAGFFKITCGQLEYGEYWPPEIERHMATYWLMPWFQSMAEALLVLKEKRYAAILDIENSRGWLEFAYAEDRVYLNIADAGADAHPSFIHRGESERFPEDVPRRFAVDVACAYRQFRDEIILKTTRYLSEVLALNPGILAAPAPRDSEQAAFRADVERLRQALTKLSPLH